MSEAAAASGNPFVVLGIEAGSDETAIKKAFRRKAVDIHPDSNGAPSASDGAAMQRLVAARDEAMRIAAGAAAARRGPSPIFDDLQDRLNSLGRGRSQGRDPMTGADVEGALAVDAATFASGGTMAFRRSCDCPACSGPRTDCACRVCAGAGVKLVSKGAVSLDATCPACRGAGRVAAGRAECIAPGGEPVAVEVPAGSRPGQVLVLKGRGMPGPAGRGDLILTLAAGPRTPAEEAPARRPAAAPRRFSVDVSVVEAACGGTVRSDLPGLGPVEIPVPPGTQSGRAFRCRIGGVVAEIVVRVVIPDASCEPLRSAFERVRSIL